LDYAEERSEGMKTAPILLVEDDDNDVLFLRSSWKKADIANALQVVTDGQKAVDYLSGLDQYVDRTAHPLPCLVLLDLNLPCKTGFEVLQWIRDHPEHGTLLVVVLTSSSAEKDAHRAYLLGANSYVVKPSSPEKLRELVNLLKLYWIGWNYAPPGMSTS
jgi:CheY-like chemotaxis protein